MPVIDASFVADLRRGHQAAEAALHRLAEVREPLLLPTQAAAEYLAGVEDPVVALHDLETTFQLVFPERDHVVEMGRIARAAFASGRFPGWADTHIAATARLENMYVVTADREHFVAAGCRVWDYRNERDPPGPTA